MLLEGQNERSVCPFHDFVERERQTSRSIKFEVGRNGSAAGLQKTAKQPHKTATQLYQFEFSI